MSVSSAATHAPRWALAARHMPLLGLTLQLHGVAWLAAGRASEPGPQPVPPEIDHRVATRMVGLLTARVAA